MMGTSTMSRFLLLFTKDFDFTWGLFKFVVIINIAERQKVFLFESLFNIYSNEEDNRSPHLVILHFIQLFRV